MADSNKVPTLCRMCPQNCGIEVRVENGKPLEITASKEHPFNKAWLCAKGRAALGLFNSSRRLKTPMIKKNGAFVSIGWGEALDFAAGRLKEIRDCYGPQALALYHGEGAGHQEIKGYMKRFANVYGTPNFTGVGSLCNMARAMADTLTLGGVTKPHMPNTGLLIFCGGNPMVSNEPVPPGEISRLRKMAREPLCNPSVHGFKIWPEGRADGWVGDAPWQNQAQSPRYGKNPFHVVQLPEGWEEANANELTGLEDVDPISGFPNLKSLRCQLLDNNTPAP